VPDAATGSAASVERRHFRVSLAWRLGLPQSAPGRFHLGFGSGAVGPGRALDALARFQFLVDQEEVLDLQPVECG